MVWQEWFESQCRQNTAHSSRLSAKCPTASVCQCQIHGCHCRRFSHCTEPGSRVWPERDVLGSYRWRCTAVYRYPVRPPTQSALSAAVHFDQGGGRSCCIRHTLLHFGVRIRQQNSAKPPSLYTWARVTDACTVLSPDTTFTIAPPGNVNSLWHQRYDLSLEGVGFYITLRQHSTAYQQACVTCSPHFSKKWGARLTSEKPVRWLTSDGNDVSSMLGHELLMKCVCCMLEVCMLYAWLPFAHHLFFLTRGEE